MRTGLYVCGAIGLGALLGAGCGGVRVDPVEGWDEPVATQQFRYPERIEYLEEKLRETNFGFRDIRGTSTEDALEIAKGYVIVEMESEHAPAQGILYVAPNPGYVVSEIESMTFEITIPLEDITE